MTTTDYQPIDCELYSQYEVYILHRTPLRVDTGAPEGGVCDLHCRAVDLQTRDGAEFICLQDAGGHRRWVRLDHLLRVSTGGA